MRQILLTLAIVAVTAISVAAQTDFNNSNDTWIPCKKIGAQKIDCPRLAKERNLEGKRVIDLETIEDGEEFYLRRAGECFPAVTVWEQDMLRFVRLPTNVDCEDGQPILSVLSTKRLRRKI